MLHHSVIWLCILDEEENSYFVSVFLSLRVHTTLHGRVADISLYAGLTGFNYRWLKVPKRNKLPCS